MLQEANKRPSNYSDTQPETADPGSIQESYLTDQVSSYRVNSRLSSAFYIPNFISQDEADYLWNRIYSAPKPKWTQLKRRRLQNWGVIPLSEKPGSAGFAEPLPDWLDRIGKRIGALGVFERKNPNHCLVNEYKLEEGIMPHQDGPHYYPTVATISLGSPTLLSFFPHRDQVEPDTSNNSGENIFKTPEAHLVLEPNSLIVLRDDLYKSYLHGIDETSSWDTNRDLILNRNHLSTDLTSVNNDLVHVERTGTRVSLTFRVWTKVISKSKFALFKK